MSHPANRNTVFVGIDGGGTGTRARIARDPGVPLGDGRGGPSGLALGIDPAWAAIEVACRSAFATAGVAFDWGRCALGCGLAGVNHAAWRQAFIDAAPPTAALAVASDSFTSLLGAHGGKPGVMVALGTGSVGEALHRDGTRVTVGGYGFPSGDEASGAWLGLRALPHAQQALDGRVARDAFAEAVLRVTGAEDRAALLAWSCAATQTTYATLAPAVLANAGHPAARRLLEEAGREIGKMIDALDPSGTLDIALCGGLSGPLAEFVPTRHAARLGMPLADATQGALLLAASAALA